MPSKIAVLFLPGMRISAMTKQEANELLIKENVRWVQVQFVDIFGRLRCVYVPAKKFTEATLWESGVNFDGSSIGFVSAADSDMNAHPDPATVKILPAVNDDPAQKTALVICNIRHAKSREPFDGDPRTIALKADRLLKENGFDQAFLLSEMEFFIFNSLEAAQVENDVWGFDSNIGGGSLKVIPTLIKPLINHDYIIKPKQGYFLAPPEDRVAAYRSEVCNAMECFGFPVKYHHHENGNGQHEIEFDFIPGATAAADAVIVFKQISRMISHKYGFVPTFMPKPLFADLGSGQHVHFYVTRKGRNAFFDPKRKENLSQTARDFIGGVLHYAREMTAVTNPIINSYKRLVPEFEAPVFVSWSYRNRTALIRVAASTSKNHIDIEPRQADPSCNPYLVYALYLQAGLEGLKKKIPCGEPVIGDVTKIDSTKKKEMGVVALPATLDQALDLMEESSFVKKVLGPNLFEHYLRSKRQEDFNKRIYVSPWEHYQYFNI
jgi:glutamine synthetase